MHEYVLALIGGVMIGLAALMLMATRGEILGVSGIVRRLLPPIASGWNWRLSFIAGVFLSPLVAFHVFGYKPVIEITSSLPLLIGSGLLVGIGTVVGNGCTSGHGVCGLSRLSNRSAVATSVFMSIAIVTVYFTQHVFGS